MIQRTLKYYIHKIVSQKAYKNKNNSVEATIMGKMINWSNNQDTVKRLQLLYIFGKKQGINKFSHKGYSTAYGEMLQTHQITLFRLIKVADLNPREREKYH